MTANDTATRRVTTGIVLAVGLFAGSGSYSHIYTLARHHHCPPAHKRGRHLEPLRRRR